MRIESLLEIIQVNKDHKKSDKEFKDDRHNERRLSRVGDYDDHKTGYYGRVYDKPDQHTLIKANYVSEDPKNDPYLIYINYIADNNLAAQNPFLPRVYEIRTLEDVRGRVKYKIEIERLQRLDDIPDDVITGIANSLFEPENIDAVRHRVYSTPALLLAACVSAVCMQKIESKNELLNAAAAIVHKIKKSNSRFSYDLHKGNIMVRLSPYPQLVILDPISQESTTY